MSSTEIRSRIQFHHEEAQRLLLHPFVSEFQHHASAINKLQPELQRQIEAEDAAKLPPKKPVRRTKKTT